MASLPFSFLIAVGSLCPPPPPSPLTAWSSPWYSTLPWLFYDYVPHLSISYAPDFFYRHCSSHLRWPWLLSITSFKHQEPENHPDTLLTQSRLHSSNLPSAAFITRKFQEGCVPRHFGLPLYKLTFPLWAKCRAKYSEIAKRPSWITGLFHGTKVSSYRKSLWIREKKK